MFKPLRMTDTMVVISVSDPSIDWEAVAEKDLADSITKWEAEKVPDGGSRGQKPEKKSVETLKMEAVARAIRNPATTMDLQIKAGEQPCRFTIGVVPGDEVVRIESESRTLDVQRWRWALSGMVDVTGLGKPKKRTVGDVEYVDPEWIKQTFVRWLQSVAMEIGWYVRCFNKTTEDEVRG